MAGHPTIGTAFALARVGVIAPQRERIVFGLGIGPTPVTLTWTDRELDFAWMTQLPPVFSEPITDTGSLAAALGLSQTALSATLPVQIVSCGLPYVLAPLVARDDVDRAVVNDQTLTRWFREAGVDANGVFVFSVQAASDNATAYSRMFAPAIGVQE